MKEGLCDTVRKSNPQKRQTRERERARVEVSESKRKIELRV